MLSELSVELKPSPYVNTNLFSIIAVHGLNGHRRDTWTYTDNERTVLWLKDLLPEMITTARIMTFGYNATVVGCTSTNDINDNAGVLLRELLNKREFVGICSF